jgi:hypothetical protein
LQIRRMQVGNEGRGVCFFAHLTVHTRHNEGNGIQRC